MIAMTTEDEKENQQVAAVAAAVAEEAADNTTNNNNNAPITASAEQGKVAAEQAERPNGGESSMAPAEDQKGEDSKFPIEGQSKQDAVENNMAAADDADAVAHDDDAKNSPVETAEKQIVDDASAEQPREDDDMKTDHADEDNNNNNKEKVQLLKDDDAGSKEQEEETTSNKESSKRPAGNEKEPDETTLPHVPPVMMPRKPIKRARTAYFIFAEEKRPEVQKQHPGEGVTAVAKALGQIWSSLSTEEKQVYQAKAAVERERVANELKAYQKNAGDIPMDAALALSSSSSSKETASSLVFPVARIRKICKLDPDVRNLSKEALVLVCKAAELTTAKLGNESVRVAQMQNRRKLLPEDVSQVCATREQFLFLREDISDLARQQTKEAAAAASKAKNASKASGMPQSKPLTDFFAPKQSSDKS